MNISASEVVNVAGVDNIKVSLSQRDRVRVKLASGTCAIVIHMSPREAASVIQLLEALISLEGVNS